MRKKTQVIQPEKTAAIAEIVANLDKSTAAVLTDYRGLTAEEMTELRRNLRKAGINFKIFKNTLSSIAAREAGLDELEQLLIGPTAIAFGYEEPTTLAKLISEFAKKHDALEIKGGVFANQVIDSSKVTMLATLPSRETLISQFVGLLNMPIARLVNVLNKPVRDLAVTLNQVVQTKQ